MVVERRNVLVDTRIDRNSREILNWALVKVAEPGDCVIALHVCRSSRGAAKNKVLLEDYLEVYEGLCSLKKVDLVGKVCTGISIQRTLVREAKKLEATALVLGSVRSWTSTARYCAKRLPATTDVFAIRKGKIVHGRCSNNQLSGLVDDPKPSLIECHLSDEVHSEFGDSEVYTDLSSFENQTRDGSSESSPREVMSLPSFSNESMRRSTSHFVGDILDQKPGWPLLRRSSLTRAESLQARELSVVQWAMSLPIRSSNKYPLGSFIERSESLEENSSSSSYASDELQNGLDILLKAHSSNCKWFNYEILKTATSKFCSENLIGQGGCSRVYKGSLPDGKMVAVKVRNSSEEATKDLAQEVEIISSFNHTYVTRLIGICIKDFDLVSVYDLASKGSLEDILHGDSKEKSDLSWDVRFSIAIKIAEALNYLHNECSPPVIHRDVKSSNILLSDEFQPQLSDFGLAIWGPTSSSFTTQADVVGTFGYLAPEYFMYGKVSDKIDVYAFGVVLLELLSGRKPIGYQTPKGQESLVMWAKPIIDSGNVKGILDPNLDENLDEGQMQRMVLAANLCITRAARLRPKMSEVLKLLRGDKDAVTWVTLRKKDLDDLENQEGNDDEVYPDSCAESHLNLALLDVDDDLISFSSFERGNLQYIEEYMKDRWSRSSSFN
ncbi:protein kinase STUNTED-like [Mercurialis annua]|uniref:protein kinase STUNTED-like n=1 Tax=Mercurialis annua TaxID=3986 RepID=UPI00215FDE14|nr:protein kinase STUNTED-like [Mercurialis annua]